MEVDAIREATVAHFFHIINYLRVRERNHVRSFWERIIPNYSDTHKNSIQKDSEMNCQNYFGFYVITILH